VVFKYHLLINSTLASNTHRSPTAPYLIAKAYRDAGEQPPILVVCVRDPIDQTKSWWRYENNAMEWGRSMGLSEWNNDLRSVLYPPNSIFEALEYSMSQYTSDLFIAAEALVKNMADKLIVSRSTDKFHLPPWAMTWPGGQLAGIGRNSAYASNISRYEKVFQDAFGTRVVSSLKYDGHESSPLSLSVNNSTTNLEFVTVIPIEYFSCGSKICDIFSSIMKKIGNRERNLALGQSFYCEETLTEMVARATEKKIHRNAGSPMTNILRTAEPTSEDENRLACLYKKEVLMLESLCGINFGWKTSL